MIKYDNGFPDSAAALTLGYSNSTFDNVFIFCEHVATPTFKTASMVLKIIVMLSLVALMMGLGVTMEPKKILKFAKRPVGATIATVVQFGVMPFVAYGLGLLFKMGEIKMLTMVILGCCPGGTLSNFMAARSQLNSSGRVLLNKSSVSTDSNVNSCSLSSGECNVIPSGFGRDKTRHQTICQQ